MRTLILYFLILSNTASNLKAQGIIDRMVDRTKQKINDRIENKIDQATDKVLDEAEKSMTPNEREEKRSQNTSNQNKEAETVKDRSIESSRNEESSRNLQSGQPLQVSSKYDFVPGEKIVATEDFAQDAVGDFPAKWNTNGTGEIVTLGNHSVHWLKVGPETVLYPEFISGLPDNFTLEFDLICSDNFDFYSTWFLTNIVASTTDDISLLNDWKLHGTKENGVRIGLHPHSAEGTQGRNGIWVYQAGNEIMKNESDFKGFYYKNDTKVHVAMWRQKGRLRVYVNQDKILDIPRAFSDKSIYNRILFTTAGYNNENDRYYLSNLRLAVGAPDTRNKLLTEGKFSTTGIKFDSGSDIIKPESYGVLKEIADVLKENATIQVKIVGHTDSDGDEKSNQVLSEKRAIAVKNSLTKDFGIENTRLQAEGKGESQPADTNNTPAGKANNRRVEFIKL